MRTCITALLLCMFLLCAGGCVPHRSAPPQQREEPSGPYGNDHFYDEDYNPGSDRHGRRHR